MATHIFLSTSRILRTSLTLIVSAFLVFIHAEPAFAQNTKNISAKRGPHESHLELAKKYGLTSGPLQAQIDDTSVYGSADEFEAANWRMIPAWSDIDEVTSAFHYVRDLRYLRWGKENFLRRLSWLYPDDGCYARAELARANLKNIKNTDRTAKIFVFGDLRVQTENSPQQYVEWWYHVAPIVRVGNEFYVFDPAISPTAPLTANKWIEKQAESVGKVTVSICASQAYQPDSDCLNPVDEMNQATMEQMTFLDYEWERQLNLGRVPDQVLGENPPWSKKSSPMPIN